MAAIDSVVGEIIIIFFSRTSKLGMERGASLSELPTLICSTIVGLTEVDHPSPPLDGFTIPSAQRGYLGHDLLRVTPQLISVPIPF